MKRKGIQKSIVIAAIISIMLASGAFCAEPKMVIELDVIPEVQITKISINPGKFNEPTIWIVTDIKNISNRPMQYETRCNFPEIDTSVAAIVPNAVGKIKPGAVGKATYQYPLNELPKKLTIKVVESIVEE